MKNAKQGFRRTELSIRKVLKNEGVVSVIHEPKKDYVYEMVVGTKLPELAIRISLCPRHQGRAMMSLDFRARGSRFEG